MNKNIHIYWRETGIHVHAHFMGFSDQNYTVSVLPVERLSQFSTWLKTCGYFVSYLVILQKKLCDTFTEHYSIRQ
jgi:hypothetical protein